MDAESHNYKMKPCPRKTSTQCLFWAGAALAMLIFLATFAVVGRMEQWSLFKEVLVSIGATFSMMWCIWTIHTFRSIIGWWVHMHDQLDSVHQILSETKQDLNELKSIKQGK